MQAIARFHQLLGRWARQLGPYVVLELLLPGGTLFALLLFLYRRVGLLQAGHGVSAEIRCARPGASAAIARDVEMARCCSTSL